MENIKAECSACGGTGLYSGMCEPEGVAVVCLHCEGTGCEIIRYEPFEKRRGKRGITTVRRSKGIFIATGTGPIGGSISYEDFQNGKMP